MNRRTLIASAALTALAAAQPADAAGVLNGLFSNGLEGWTSEGDVTAVSTHGFVYVRMQETFAPTPDDPQNQRKPQASRSRLYQDFIVPEDATDLAFRFRLASTPRTRDVEGLTYRFQDYHFAAAAQPARPRPQPLNDPSNTLCALRAFA